jgi:polygalacturonase
MKVVLQLLALPFLRLAAAALRPTVVCVTEHDVVCDGQNDDTKAMQRLFDTVPPNTVVVVPAGCVVITGPLTVRQHNFTLQVDGRLQAWDITAAVLRKAWPRLPPLPSYGDSRDAGRYLQYQALVYAVNVTNLRIIGQGLIDGRGQAWWDAFKLYNRTDPRTQILEAGRPNLVQIVNSTEVEISSIQMQDSPFWTLHPVLSDSIHIHDITIRAPLYAPNVDGIDIE